MKTNPKIDEITEYMNRVHSGRFANIELAIRDCAERGFPLGLIIYGVERRFRTPHGFAKRLVCSHPVWGKNAAREWDRLHTEVLKVMEECAE